MKTKRQKQAAVVFSAVDEMLSLGYVDGKDAVCRIWKDFPEYARRPKETHELTMLAWEIATMINRIGQTHEMTDKNSLL